MIRACLAIIVFSFIAFNGGRVYEYRQNIEALNVNEMVMKITAALEAVPVGAMK